MPTCPVVKRMLSTRTRMLHIVHHSCSCIIMDAFSEYLKQGPACTLKTQKEKRSVLINKKYYERIVNYMKGGGSYRMKIQLLDLPEADLRDILVVRVKKGKAKLQFIS